LRFFLLAYLAVAVAHTARADDPGKPEIYSLSPEAQAAPAPAPPKDTAKIVPKESKYFSVKNYAGRVGWECDGDAVVSGKSVKGAVVPMLSADGKLLQSEVPVGSLIVIGVKAGSVKIKALGINSEGDPVTLASILLTVDDGTKPNPPPIPPKPEPEPTPQPVASKLYFVVVEDVQARTVETAKVLNNQLWWQNLKAAGHSYKWYDKSSAEAAGVAYAKYVADKSIPLPALVVADAASGKVLDTLPLPTTAAMDTLIKKFTGK
jgi:hypothetical protein